MFERRCNGGFNQAFRDLAFGVVEILECILGEAFVFFCIGQRDGGHALMPVSTVDQFVEFG